jgi:hypothetical protein
VFFAPRGHEAKNGSKGLAMPSQGVFDAGRNLRVDLSNDDVIAFEFAELLSEHFLGGSGEQSLQFAEPPDLGLQVVENRRLPFASDDMSRERDGAMQGVHGSFPSDTWLLEGAYWQKRDFSLNSPRLVGKAGRR